MYHKPQSKQKWQYSTKNGVDYICREIVVHRFEITSGDDAILLAAEPLWAWQQSEAGKWVMYHAVEQPRWDRFEDHCNFTSKFAVIARLTEQDITFFELKFK